MSRLDKLALCLIAVIIGFVALVSHSPFALGMLCGAGILAAYGFRTKRNDLMIVAPFLPGFGLLAWWVNWWVFLVTPHTIDSKLLVLDRGVGVAVWRWTGSHSSVYDLLSVVYYGLGIAAAIALCSTPRLRQLVRAYVLAAFLAPPFYVLFPAVGPRWIGHNAARNCIPSLHFTWALLLFLYSGPRVRRFMFVFMILTATATMGLGEHYAIDLLAALPFTAAVYAISNSQWLRSRQLKAAPHDSGARSASSVSAERGVSD